MSKNLTRTIKKYLPKNLLGRSLLIIVTPVVLLQLVSAVLFWESHWDKITLRLARNLAGDIGFLVDYMRDHPEPRNLAWMVGHARHKLDLRVSLAPDGVMPNRPRNLNNLGERLLDQAMRDYVRMPFHIDTQSLDDLIRIEVQLPRGVLTVITTRKRLFSSTAVVFIAWTLGLSLLLFGVAIIFMRNQVRPIRKLAIAADDFGKGRTDAAFKPEGASEVRQAAQAFIDMRDRLHRQIRERTDMLSGVSHDLRTPLTRMKLQLAMSDDMEGVADLRDDINEMDHMLDGYLAFARGEGGEKPEATNLSKLLTQVAEGSRRKGHSVDLHIEGDLVMPLRPQAFKRCLTNIVENAARYGDHVWIRAGRRGDQIDITVDDDGPGIPPENHADVFKPFFRLDASRNPETGGVGLGLAISRDIMRVHGGSIELSDSPMGGLRARLLLPI